MLCSITRRRRGLFRQSKRSQLCRRGLAGTSFAAEILVSPDGKFVYAGNRLHDTIAVFAVGADGLLKWTGETSTLGDYPGQCRIDPSGEFLVRMQSEGRFDHVLQDSSGDGGAGVYGAVHGGGKPGEYYVSIAICAETNACLIDVSGAPSSAKSALDGAPCSRTNR